MSRRLAALIAPLALLFGAEIATAQHHGGGHGGGGHPGGHGGGVYHGGGAYHGGYYNNGHSHNTFALGIGIGLGGYGYGGYGGYGGYAYPSYGYPMYGGYSYYSYPSYGYAVPVAPPVIVNPSTSYYASPAASAPAAIPSAAPATIPATAMAEPVPGLLTVIVPAGAQVWFDGKETGKAEGNRIFSTPALEPGKSAVLTLKVEIDGNASQMRIPLKAGDRMTLDMRK